MLGIARPFGRLAFLASIFVLSHAVHADQPVVTRICPVPLPDSDESALCVFFAQGSGLTGASTTVSGQRVTTMPLSDCIMAVKCTTLPPSTVPVTVTTSAGSATVPVTFAAPCDPTADLACLLDLLPCFQDQGLVRNQGALASLSQQLSNALASLQRGQTTPAIHQLDATAHYISAQAGQGFATALSTALGSFLDEFLLPCIGRITFGSISGKLRTLGACAPSIRAGGRILEAQLDDRDEVADQVFANATGHVDPECLPAVVTLTASIAVSGADGGPIIAQEPVSVEDSLQTVSSPDFNVSAKSKKGFYVERAVNRALEALDHPKEEVKLSISLTVLVTVVDSCGCSAADRRLLSATATYVLESGSKDITGHSIAVFPPLLDQQLGEMSCEIFLSADSSASLTAVNSNVGTIRQGFTVFDGADDCLPVTVSGVLTVSLEFTSDASGKSTHVSVASSFSEPESAAYSPGGTDSFGYRVSLSSLNGALGPAGDQAADKLGVAHGSVSLTGIVVSITLIATDSCGCVETISMSSMGVL